MNSDKWHDELALLRSVMDKSGLSRTIKWGAEVYVHAGRNVVSFGGFRNYFALWFYNGVFLKDKYKVLVNAQENKTKALRQWRFTSKEEIDERLILEYIREAVQNEKKGKVWRPEKAAPAKVPRFMMSYFRKDSELKAAFRKLAPYRQREYIDHIASAKREETKVARMDKAIPRILQGVGLHDKYRG